jgi:hypothetical protein
MNGSAAGLEEVLALAMRLPPVQKVRLVEQLMTTLERELSSPMPKPQSLNTWRGLCADLGPAPSAEAIDQARRETWTNFPRDDIS